MTWPILPEATTSYAIFQIGWAVDWTPTVMIWPVRAWVSVIRRASSMVWHIGFSQ